MHLTALQLPNGLAALILFALALYAWHKRVSLLALPFAGIMLLGAFWGLCNTMELAGVTLEAKILWNRLHFLPSTLVVVVLFSVVLKSRGRTRWLAPRRFLIFLVEPAAAFVLALSGWGDRLFLSAVGLSYAGPQPILVSVAGPLYWMHAAYTGAMLTGSLVLIGSWGRDSQPRFRTQSRSIIVSMIIPGLTGAFFHFGLSPLPGIDLTPAALVLTGIVAAVAVFHYRIADIVPIAGRLIVRTMEDLTLVVDSRDHLVDFNPSARTVVGMDPRDATGRTLADLPSPWAGVFAPYAGVSSARDTVRVELAAGVRWYDLAVSGLRDESGAAVGRLFHLHDVTERKEIEEELRESREQLIQAQKMEAIGRLAGGIAHDFNNLLTVITGYSDVVNGGLAEDHPLKAPMGEISRAARRAAELTGQLLAFGRKQVLQPRVIGMNDLVARMEKMLARVIGEDIRLVTSLHPEAGNVRADPGSLEQVIMNLAVNARDAMPSGGTLAIATRACLLDQGFVRGHPEASAGSYVRLTVSDTGIGMESAVLSRIFEPFFTTKPMGKGTGFGLPIAYGIVRQSGGHILCSSEPGKGSTFSIYLPRVEDGESREVPDDAAAFPGGSETILLVEDDDTVRGFTSILLKKSGYTVIEAVGGEEALSAAAAHNGTIHLLVTDVVMPRMSGLELVPAIRKACPEIRVLYISGYAESAIPWGDEPRPPGSFVQKPFTPAGILRSIRDTLTGG